MGRDDPLEPPPARVLHRPRRVASIRHHRRRSAVIGRAAPTDCRSGDEVGRAEALAYETVEAQADPRDPTTKYFLNRFLHDHFGRRRATAQEYWPRSLRFLTTDLANAAFTASNEEIALLAAGITGEELRVENVVLRIQPNPTEPHGAVADFVLVRTRQEREVSREAWTATMQFVFMPVIPADLVIVNPMGIQVTYLETDRTLITETP